MADFNAAVTRVSGFFPIFTSTPFTCSGVCVFEIFICSDLTTLIRFHAIPNVLATIDVVYTPPYFLGGFNIKSNYNLNRISLEVKKNYNKKKKAAAFKDFPTIQMPVNLACITVQ